MQDFERSRTVEWLRRLRGDRNQLEMAFAAKGVRLPPVDPAEVVAGVPELAAEILIFDLWVANGDRHRGNLAYLPAERRLDVFDHSHALLGAAPANSVARYTDVVARGDFVVDGHCLLAELRVANDLVNAVDRCLATARDAAIERVCEDSIALGLVSKADGPQLIGDLLQRQGALKDLLRIYQAKFTGIDPASWGFV